MPIRSSLIPRFFFLATALLSSLAHAETTQCNVVPTVPFTINSQGIWCFTGDLATNVGTGSAITIAVNNVTLDMNGYKLGGLAAGNATQTVGISGVDRFNVTIRNGTIRGFLNGIELSGGQGHLIEDVRAEQNKQFGILVGADNSIVRNNIVVDTGGSAVADKDDAAGIRIFLNGGVPDGVRILANDVTGVEASGLGAGLRVGPAQNVIISGNRVTGVSSTGGEDTAGIALGFAFAIVENNSIYSRLGIDYGIQYVISAGGYKDNIVGGATTAFSSGTDLGGNNSF